MDSTNKFISNINRTSQKPIEFIKANDLDITRSYAFIFIAVISFGLFAWWLVC